MATEAPAGLLASGKAFADLSHWRKVGVSGADAFGWLNDLVSADVSGLEPDRAIRSLLLSPTGRIRAEFTVTLPGGLVLVQDPSQPRSIQDLLEPYVLSSDVELRDRTADFALFAFPGRDAAPQMPGTAGSAPSVLGVGADLFAPGEDHDGLRRSLQTTFVLAGGEDVEAWRVRSGLARFGVDALEEDLPQEAGFEGAVSFGKGCYLGQEAVAKVRNLGHPRRLVLRLRAGGPVSPGDPVLVADRVEADPVADPAGGVPPTGDPAGGEPAGGEPVGQVTSVADGVLLARIRWDARQGPFRTPEGVELRPIPASG
jgi:tRNA-modifying protein YgfZ